MGLFPDKPSMYSVTFCHVYEDDDGVVNWEYDHDNSAKFMDPVPVPERGDLVILDSTLHKVIDIGFEYLGVMAADDFVEDIQPTVEIIVFVVVADGVGDFVFGEA